MLLVSDRATESNTLEKNDNRNRQTGVDFKKELPLGNFSFVNNEIYQLSKYEAFIFCLKAI
jgi:hypothetical protein